MRLEIGESLTFEFDRKVLDENSMEIPVAVYGIYEQTIEILSINTTIRKKLLKFMEKTVEPVVFINVKRVSKLRYDISPGTAIIIKDKKSLYI